MRTDSVLIKFRKHSVNTAVGFWEGRKRHLEVPRPLASKFHIILFFFIMKHESDIRQTHGRQYEIKSNPKF